MLSEEAWGAVRLGARVGEASGLVPAGLGRGSVQGGAGREARVMAVPSKRYPDAGGGTGRWVPAVWGPWCPRHLGRQHGAPTSRAAAESGGLLDGRSLEPRAGEVI